MALQRAPVKARASGKLRKTKEKGPLPRLYGLCKVDGLVAVQGKVDAVAVWLNKVFMTRGSTTVEKKHCLFVYAFSTEPPSS